MSFRRMSLMCSLLALAIGCGDADPSPSSSDSAGGLPSLGLPDDDQDPGDGPPQSHRLDKCAAAMRNDPTYHLRHPLDPIEMRSLQAQSR